MPRTQTHTMTGQPSCVKRRFYLLGAGLAIHSVNLLEMFLLDLKPDVLAESSQSRSQVVDQSTDP